MVEMTIQKIPNTLILTDAVGQPAAPLHSQPSSRPLIKHSEPPLPVTIPARSGTHTARGTTIAMHTPSGGQSLPVPVPVVTRTNQPLNRSNIHDTVKLESSKATTTMTLRHDRLPAVAPLVMPTSFAPPSSSCSSSSSHARCFNRTAVTPRPVTTSTGTTKAAAAAASAAPTSRDCHGAPVGSSSSSCCACVPHSTPMGIVPLSAGAHGSAFEAMRGGIVVGSGGSTTGASADAGRVLSRGVSDAVLRLSAGGSGGGRAEGQH